jgi:hypothetical protein
MGVMAMGAEKIGPLTADEITCSFSVNACLPVPIEVAMAFTAEPITLSKINELSIEESKFVSIFCIVAVETPSHSLGVMEFNLGMFFLQFPPLAVHLHGGMAVATGEQTFCNRGRGNRELLYPHGRGYEMNHRKEDEYEQSAYFLHVYY